MKKNLMLLLLLLPCLLLSKTPPVNGLVLPVQGEVYMVGYGVPGLTLVLVRPDGLRDTTVTHDDGTFSFKSVALVGEDSQRCVLEVYWGHRGLLYRHGFLLFPGFPKLHISLK